MIISCYCTGSLFEVPCKVAVQGEWLGLMFGNTGLDISSYPDLEALSNASFSGLVNGIKAFMPNKSEKEIMIKAYNLWASVHGLVGILRRSEREGNRTETLKWIEKNLEEYLEKTTFS